MSSKKQPAKRRRGPGKPLPAGAAHPLSAASRLLKKQTILDLEAKLKAYEDRDLLEAQRDEHGGVVSADRMRKVMGQPKELDRGPTEARLRDWLDKDVRTYSAEMAKLAAADRDAAGVLAENERLKAELAAVKKTTAAGFDEGTAEAKKLIDRILAEHG